MDDFERRQLFDRACEALRSGQPARSLAMLDQLAAERPPMPSVPLLRSHVLLLLDNHEEALAEAERGVELAPRSDAAQRALARAAWRANRLSQAQQALEEAVRLAERSAESLADYAEFMACERGPRLGEQAAREALAADDRSATAWAALGIAQHRLREQQPAEASLRKALDLDPGHARAQWGLAQLLRERGAFAEADTLAAELAKNRGAEGLAAEIRDEAARRRTVEKLYEKRAEEDADAAELRWHRYRLAAGGAVVAIGALAALGLLWLARTR